METALDLSLAISLIRYKHSKKVDLEYEQIIQCILYLFEAQSTSQRTRKSVTSVKKTATKRNYLTTKGLAAKKSDTPKRNDLIYRRLNEYGVCYDQTHPYLLSSSTDINKTVSMLKLLLNWNDSRQNLKLIEVFTKELRRHLTINCQVGTPNLTTIRAISRLPLDVIQNELNRSETLDFKYSQVCSIYNMLLGLPKCKVILVNLSLSHIFQIMKMQKPNMRDYGTVKAIIEANSELLDLCVRKAERPCTSTPASREMFQICMRFHVLVIFQFKERRKLLLALLVAYDDLKLLRLVQRGIPSK